MTNEELVEKVKNGEPWATLELWKAVEKFIQMKAGLYLLHAGKHAKVEYDDLVQVGFFAMMDAVEKYDPSRGCSFVGFLGYALKTRFAEEGGHKSSKRDALMLAGSTNEPITADDPDSDTIGDLVADPGWEYAFCLVEYREFISYVRVLIGAALSRLAPRQRECIEKHYLLGMTMEETAGGRSKQSADSAIQNGLRILRRGKYRRQLWEALQGFSDFDELRAEGRKNIELKAVAKAQSMKKTPGTPF